MLAETLQSDEALSASTSLSASRSMLSMPVWRMAALDLKAQSER